MPKDLRHHLLTRYPTPTPQFLNWIADRLVHVYGESENVDFVLSLRQRAKDIEEWGQPVPEEQPDCPCGQPIPYDIFHRGPIEPEGVEHHCTCGRIWVGTADPKVLTMKWGSKCKTEMCSECGVNPEPSYGGWCPDCACGAESGCPRKYGQRGEPCPHDWCPHGGISPNGDWGDLSEE